VEAEEAAVGGCTWIAVQIACLLSDPRPVVPGHWFLLEKEAKLRHLSWEA
jgi:hypothetical protein